MKGYEVIAKLTDHFRRHKEAPMKPIVFVVHGSVTPFRVATVKADGARTVVTLVRADS